MTDAEKQIQENLLGLQKVCRKFATDFVFFVEDPTDTTRIELLKEELASLKTITAFFESKLPS